MEKHMQFIRLLKVICWQASFLIELKNLNDFQNKAVSTLLAYKNQLIIVKSQKFTGKTMLASKLFEQAENDVIIYHTGCCPELFKKW